MGRCDSRTDLQSNRSSKQSQNRRHGQSTRPSPGSGCRAQSESNRENPRYLQRRGTVSKERFGRASCWRKSLKCPNSEPKWREKFCRSRADFDKHLANFSSMNVVFPQRIEKFCRLTNFSDKLLCHGPSTVKKRRREEMFVSLCVCVYTQLQQTSSPLFFFRPGKQTAGPDGDN